MYHRFEGLIRATARSVRRREFRARRVKGLKDDLGIEVVLDEGFLAWRGAKIDSTKERCGRIDDGYLSGYAVTSPILKEMGYPFTMFIYTNYVGAGGKSISSGTARTDA